MVIQSIIILSLLITQALCAPTTCIESCSSYTNQYHTQLSGVPNHGDIKQDTSQLQGLDYSRPGTWTEHNEYNINNGKVHEEKGQIVDGHKTVRYYKKNYSSSSGVRYPSGSRISEAEQLSQSNNYRQGVYVPSSDSFLNTYNQRTYDQVGSSDSIGQQHDYNRIQSQPRTQSLIKTTNRQSERLEDFGEHSENSEGVQQSVSGLNTQVSQQPSYTNTQSGNWSKVDSYNTNGGHGRVFEEEGLYTTGPKKVRYYKRNYTSSYSSSSGLPIPDITNIGVDNIHRDIENIHREIGLDQIHRNIENSHREIGKSYNQVSTVQGITSSNTAQTNINSDGDLNTDSLHNINNNAYRHRPDYRDNLSLVQRHEQQHHTSVASEYVPHQQNPSHSTYGTNRYITYGKREGYVNTLPTSQYINPTSGYTNVLSTGNNGYNRNMYNEGNQQQLTDGLHQVEHLDEHQSTITQNRMDIDNLRQNTYNQHNVMKPDAPNRGAHYTEHWSSSHRQETSLPVYTSDISQVSQQNEHYNNQYRENSFNSAHKRRLGKLTIGAVDLSPIGNTDDCTQGTVEHSHVQSQYRRMYKRSTKDDKLSDEKQQMDQPDRLTEQTEDLTQQTDDFEDIPQQTSGKLQFGQHTQESEKPWGPSSGSQYMEDLTQQTDDFGDFPQQTTGKLQFGQQTQESEKPWAPASGSQHSEDFTQQTGGFDDFTQQTGGFDDFTQQTSGKLQFGQQTQESEKPWGPSSGSQYSEDLTQQTDDFGDFPQQTSGKLQLGQQTQESEKPWTPASGSQHSEDLAQQTGGFDDFTQQTSGKVQFGQQTEESEKPWGPSSGSQHSEDLTQQTGGFDDFTQQTGGFDDFTQQTSGKLELGQQTQESEKAWGPSSGSQHSEDLTQQTGGFDDFTQQTSGKVQLGQQTQESEKPWGPSSSSQHSEDLTQQTAGKLLFGQQTQESEKPWGPSSGSQHSEDLTQQTGGFDDFTQQTGGFDDFTQQTSGKLELGQQTQESEKAWGPSSGSQHSEDLTQQTGGFDDFTQQTSGKVQLGQQTQESEKPWGPSSGSQRSEDLTQQTGGFDDFTQQTSGKLQFGQHTQQSEQPWGSSSGSQHSEDLTQQTGGFDDFTQQTSGKLQFGQQTQQSEQPWGPSSGSQYSEDLTQQTGGFDDFTQQTSGKIQFGQQTQQFEEPWGPSSGSQYSGDLTQQTGNLGDFTQQSQHSQQPWRPEYGNQHSQDVTQQNDHVLQVSDINDNIHKDQTSFKPLPKPASKPKPRPRYSRVGSIVSFPTGSNSGQDANNKLSHSTNEDKLLTVSQLPPKVVPGTEADSSSHQDIRGDQGVGSSTNNDKLSSDKTEGNVFSIDGSIDQGNLLHKSNDATVGLQWHYTYHPSDERPLVLQADKKDKGGIQQQSSVSDFSNYQDNLDQQQAQHKFIVPDFYQQSSSPGKQESEVYQSQNGQESDRLEFDQQILDKTEDNSQHHLEPRILEAYGGGPYSSSHNENVYAGVTVNPSATLAPINTADSWDIQEKPGETNVAVHEITPPPSPVEPLSPDTDEATPPPSFWSRLGNRFTNTFDKAKEKAKSIFG